LTKPELLLSSATYDRQVDEAAEFVRQRVGDIPRPLGIIAGSGLVDLAGALSVEHRIAPGSIPHLPLPSVLGHHGSVLFGRIGLLETTFFAGRVHLYEERSTQESVFSIYLAARLGAKILLATNATGGINPHFRPGDLILLTDQINLTFRNLPMDSLQPKSLARTDSGGPLYDARLCEKMREAARQEKIVLKDGIYVGMLGPSYETRAESAMLRQIGADVVGMSTVGEILAARRAGLRAVGISCVANPVPVWGRVGPVIHDEVLERVGDAIERLRRLIVCWAGMVADDARS